MGRAAVAVRAAADRRISRSPSKEIAIARRWIIASLVIVPAAVLLAYAGGVLETLGYESQTLRGGGLSRTTRGLSIGTKTIYLRAGNAFFVDYDAQINAGALDVA